MSLRNRTNLDLKYILQNLNEKHMDTTSLILQAKDVCSVPCDIRAINCDASGYEVLFHSKEDSKNQERYKVAFDSKADNMKQFYEQLAALRQEALIKLKIVTLENSHLVDDFQLPSAPLMLLVIGGMGFLFCLAYRIGLNPSMSEIRENIGDELLFRVINYIYTANTIVAALSLVVSYLRGNYTTFCTCKWMISSFLFGMLSLAVQVPSRRLKLLG